MGQTVTHGTDDSGLHSRRPGSSSGGGGRGGSPNDGHAYWETDLQALRVFDETLEVWMPVEYVPFEIDISADTHDGSVGVHVLPACYVPAGTIILDGLLDVLTTFVSSNDKATLSIGVEASGDIKAAVAIDSGTSWDSGLKDIIPVGTAATSVKTTEERQVLYTVGVEPIVQGKLRGFLRRAALDRDGNG